MQIPAISLWQPWASLIIVGAKLHETRHWRAPERVVGQRMIIHAAKRPVDRDLDPELHALCKLWLGESYRDAIPRGCAIGTAVLKYSRQMTDVEPETVGDRIAGNWSPERFAWRFTAPSPLTPEIAMRGRQSIWMVDEACIAKEVG